MDKKDDLKVLSLENEPFYFESDTLALRNNQEYSCLLKTLALLEGQRIRAAKDLETLIDLKEKALKDPLKFISLLGSQSESLNLPVRQQVYMIPEIDFNKYYDCVDLEDFEAIKNQNTQRVHSLRQSFKMIEQQQQTKSSNEMSSRRTSSRSAANNSKQPVKEAKNYNKPWSVDEQRHLEELLLEFPPEENEAARFRKIATKLGTRTPLQVQSHCQKYFIKLAKAGLPIPGRMPNLKTYVTKKGVRGRCRSTLVRGACISAARGGGRGIIGNARDSGTGRKMVGRGVSLNEISSMWTSFNPPITMNDDNELSDNEYEYSTEMDNSQSGTANFEDYEDDLNEDYDDQGEEDDEEKADHEQSEENSQNFNYDENSVSQSQHSNSTNSSQNNYLKTAFNFSKTKNK
jgi:hypothetical protein